MWQEKLLNLFGCRKEPSVLVLVLQAESGLSLKQEKKAWDIWRCVRYALPSPLLPALFWPEGTCRGAELCLFAVLPISSPCLLINNVFHCLCQAASLFALRCDIGFRAL